MNTIRQLISAAVYPLARIYQGFFPGIRILMYHRVANHSNYDQLVVSLEHFEQQMAYLQKKCRVISLEQAIKELKEGNVQSGVVVSFDDGYLDNLQNALPILKKYNIPATIFVTTGFCDQSMSHSRYINDKQRVHLNWDEVCMLAEEPGITIGSHTISHPFLSRIDAGKSQTEIRDSKSFIESKLNKSVDYFCYPSGDFSNQEIEFVKEAGYHAAVTVSPGRNHSLSSPYTLKRTEVNDKDGLDEMRYKLAGAFDPFHILLHWRRLQCFKKLSRQNKQDYKEKS